jgi:TonB-linked SusC/RagA family outer membrane protein
VQQETVSGTVTDAQTGETLPGVNILVKGTSTGTVTDSVGHYSLSISSLQDTLRFSFIGYKQQVVPINGRTQINIALEPTTIAGKELVVTAFGEKQQKITTVGAVQSIKSPSKTLKIPSSSLTHSFAGRMAGVTAMQRTGQPGENASKFYIRGISTFSGSTNPLIIVDGVRVDADFLNTIEPENIKSFSILKDATATAVYGSKGANGVMIVETKTGANLDHPQVKVRVENSIQSPVYEPQFVDGVTFMKLYNEAVISRNQKLDLYSQEKIEKTGEPVRNKYIYPNVDWYNTIFKDYSMRQKANLNILGGGERVKYYLGGTFSRDNGMLKSLHFFNYNNNAQAKRLSFVGNLDVDATPTTHIALKLNQKLNYIHGPSSSVRTIFRQVYNGNPVDFPVSYPKEVDPSAPGKVLFGGSNKNTKIRNPLGELSRGYKDNFINNSIVNVQLEQDLGFIAKNLSFKGMATFTNRYGVTTNRRKQYNSYYISSINKDSLSELKYPFTIDRANNNPVDLTLGTSNSTSGSRRVYLQARINYKKQIFRKQELSLMVLYDQDSFLDNVPNNLISSLPDRTRGVAGRVTYNYDDTYLAEINFGYNGSSNFAQGHRYGFFPSFAIGYVLSSESFWKPLKNTINLLKVRASWGEVGNKDIGGDRYVYQSRVNIHGNCAYIGRTKNSYRCGAKIDRFPNNEITWEVGKKLNIGLNMEILNSLTITANVFKENRNGIFLTRSTIPNDFGVGGTDIYGNLGSVINKGIDGQVNYNKSFSKNFFMSFKGVFSFARDKITAMDRPPEEPENLSPLGHPIHQDFGYIDEGLFKDEDDIKESPEQNLGGKVMPGDIKYKDLNGDGKITPEDRKAIGYNYVPEITYGFGPSFQYKNFDFSFLIEGVAHATFFMRDIKPFNMISTNDNNVRNVLTWIKEKRWTMQNPNTNAKYPRLSIKKNPNNAVNSTYNLRSGSFIQIKFAELGYTFNNDIRVYLSGRRLFKFSKFKVWDPELGGGNGLRYPLQRTINLGVHFDF